MVFVNTAQYYAPLDTNIISLYIIVCPKFIHLMPVCYYILQFKHAPQNQFHRTTGTLLTQVENYTHDLNISKFNIVPLVGIS